MYASNRVNHILKSRYLKQWHHVVTEGNPPDHAMRRLPAALLKNTKWILGLSFLGQVEEPRSSLKATFALVKSEVDEDDRSEVMVFCTKSTKD